MMEHARSVARAIAAKSPMTVRGIKRVALYTRDHTVADGLEHVAMLNASLLISQDLDEATSAAMTRRDPAFRGE